MIKLNIDVTKIPREKIQTNPKWKGKFLNLVLVDHPNDKGDDGFISVDTSKEERAAGEKGVIIGNWRHIGGNRNQNTESRPTQRRETPQRPTQRPTKSYDSDLDVEGDDIPF